MTKRKYLRLVSTGMVALGTLALGATAIMPVSLLVKATDGNTPVVGNKDDLDSIEATGKEAYAKAQAAAAKVKTFYRRCSDQASRGGGEEADSAD